MPPGSFRAQPLALTTGRKGHAAVLLGGDRLVLTGGSRPVSPERAGVCDFDDPCSLASAEVLDVDRGGSRELPPMPVPREAHGAVGTPAGRVLVFGGLLSGGGCMRLVRSTSALDVGAALWRAGADGPGLLGCAHALLPGGEVLLTGGMADATSAQAAILDPILAAWRAVIPMRAPRYLHACATLPGGRVLVAGGLASAPGGGLDATSAAEIYDPAAGAWTDTGPLAVARCEHSLTVLRDGSVLAIGGYAEPDAILGSVELWSPASGRWTVVGETAAARVSHTATLLPDGSVLVVGGVAGALDPPSDWQPCAAAERFDPARGLFTRLDGPRTPRFGHTATRLPGGRVVIAGGSDGAGPLASAEIFTSG